MEVINRFCSLSGQGLFNEKKLRSGSRAELRGNKRIFTRSLGSAHNQHLSGGSIKMWGITCN